MYHTWFHAILFCVPFIDEMRRGEGRGGERREERRGSEIFK
jgi:hypothetical protein